MRKVSLKKMISQFKFRKAIAPHWINPELMETERTANMTSPNAATSQKRKLTNNSSAISIDFYCSP